MPAQLSVAVTEVISAGGTRLAHCTVTFAGHVIAGPISSYTVMDCVQIEVFPQRSEAI